MKIKKRTHNYYSLYVHRYAVSSTVQILKIGTLNLITIIVLKMEQSFYCAALICPKHAAGMANSEDPDQTAPKEQSDVCLHCLPKPICSNI